MLAAAVIVLAGFGIALVEMYRLPKASHLGRGRSGRAPGGHHPGGLDTEAVTVAGAGRLLDNRQRSGLAQIPRSCISRICFLMTFSRYSLCFMGSRLR